MHKRRLRKLALGLVSVAFALLSSSTQAVAHTTVDKENSTPQPAAVITALDEIRLVFKSPLINDGKAKIRSFPLIIISSNNEPRHEAEIKPKGTPKNNPRPTAIKATDKEVCPPIIIIEKISLPK